MTRAPKHRLRERGSATGPSAVALAAIALLLAPRPGSATTPPPPDPTPKIRDVRVLVGDDVSRVRIAASRPILVETPSGERREESGALPLVLNGAAARLVRFAGAAGSPPRPMVLTSAEALRVEFERDGAWSAPAALPGWLKLIPNGNGTTDVINEIDVENYVACVTANEVWPTFEKEAFRGQAIVTRSFVLYQMTRRPNAEADVSATQGSQVYRGIRDDATGRKAAEAAEFTAGLVLTCPGRDGRDQMFCAYYSAACGGRSQPAAPLGAEGDVEPLRGGVECNYCSIAPKDAYRWGPVSLPVDEAFSRLVGRYPDAADLGGLAEVSVVERTTSGRPLTLRLRGPSGATYDILSERFRLALGGSVVRSTECRIRVRDQEVIVDEGKGFGHGLGLCQWGMQGQALQGRQAAEILRFYYPGSKLKRVY
ncbi:MAG: SpoIID/LytB domain-containing protein [Planctomycetota bacterium]